MIAVVLRRLLLQDRARARLDNGHAHEVALRVEQLRHPNFLAEKFHD